MKYSEKQSLNLLGIEIFTSHKFTVLFSGFVPEQDGVRNLEKIHYLTITINKYYIKHERRCLIGIAKHWEESWKHDTQWSIFWRNSSCLDNQWNTVSSVWYIFSIKN